MLRNVLRLFAFVVCVSLVIPSLGTGRVAHALPARQATPVVGDSIELDAGVSLEELAAGQIETPLTAPIVMRLERWEFATGVATGSRTSAGAEVFAIEQGTVFFVDEFGIEGEATPDTPIFLPLGAVYELHGTDTPATLLHMSIGSVDSAANNLPSGILSTVLFEQELGETPAAPVRMMLGRVTWESNALWTAHTSTGPVGLTVENGTLAVSDVTGLESDLASGQSMLFLANEVNQQRNATSETVTALLVALVPAADPLVAPQPTPTPQPTSTPEPTVTATPSPTSTATPSPTATSTPTPIPTPTTTPTLEPTATQPPTETAVPTVPSDDDDDEDTGGFPPGDDDSGDADSGDDDDSADDDSADDDDSSDDGDDSVDTANLEKGTVLYKANWSKGLNGWEGPSSWKVDDKILSLGGSSRRSLGGSDDNTGVATSVIIAPFESGDLADYAVDASIELVDYSLDFNANPDSCGGFGIVVRSTGDDDGYLAGQMRCGDEQLLGYGSSPFGVVRSVNTIIEDGPANPGDKFHTYRVEVEGNEIRFLIDGYLILETRDNEFLESGLVGLWSEGASINVRSFRVVTLGGKVNKAKNDPREGTGTVGGGGNIEGSTNRPVRELLPTENDIPAGMVQIDERSRSVEDLASISLDPGLTRQLLAQWGFTENVIRRFRGSDPVLIEVSIHQFGDPVSATAARDYYIQERAIAGGLSEVTVDGVGGGARAIVGQALVADAPAGTSEASLYLRIGSSVVRVTVVTANIDPFSVAVAVAQAIVAKA